MSLEKNISLSTLITKSLGGKIFQFLQCSLHHKIQPEGPGGWFWLGGNRKVQCTISKFLLSLFYSTFIEQNIFSRDMFFCLYHYKHIVGMNVLAGKFLKRIERIVVNFSTVRRILKTITIFVVAK